MRTSPTSWACPSPRSGLIQIDASMPLVQKLRGVFPWLELFPPAGITFGPPQPHPAASAASVTSVTLTPAKNGSAPKTNPVAVVAAGALVLDAESAGRELARRMINVQRIQADIEKAKKHLVSLEDGLKVAIAELQRCQKDLDARVKAMVAAET